MPATKYKSNNAYKTDYEHYTGIYSENRNSYRSAYARAVTPEPHITRTYTTAPPRRTFQSPAESPATRRAKTQVQPKSAAREKAQEKKAAKRLKIKTVAKCAAIFALAIIMIYRYVQISESGAKINELKKEYIGLNGDAQELQSNIDKSIDLSALERQAQEELGMVRPDRNQIFYVNMNGDDYGELTESEEKAGNISSASGSMIRAIDMIK